MKKVTDKLDFTPFNKKVFSQNGEDGIIEKIFELIGIHNKYFVEIGVETGSECNSRNLLENKGWKGLALDREKYGHLKHFMSINYEHITAENINNIFVKYEVPKKFDLLSIDVDGIDWYLWEAIENYAYRVLVIEYNAFVDSTKDWKVKYDPNFKWNRTNYFGASLLALNNLGKEKGYTLVCCDGTGTNAFFIKNEELPKDMLVPDIKDIFKKNRIWSKW